MNNKHWGHKSYCFRVAAAAGAFCNNTFCNPFHCQEVLLCLPPSRKDRYSLCQISSSANHLKFYNNNNNNNNWLIPLLPWRQNKTQTITNAMSHAMEGIQIHNKTAFIFYELYGSGCRWTILLLTPVACQQELCVTGEEMNSVNNPEYTIGERLWLDGEKAQRFCCTTPTEEQPNPKPTFQSPDCNRVLYSLPHRDSTVHLPCNGLLCSHCTMVIPQWPWFPNHLQQQRQQRNVSGEKVRMPSTLCYLPAIVMLAVWLSSLNSGASPETSHR